MEKPQIILGIDTFSFYFPLSYQQKEQIITNLKSCKGFEGKSDYWADSHENHSEAFADQGIKIDVFQKKRSVWGLMITIHPMLLLGNPDRSALYNPSRKSDRELERRANRILEQANIPCSLSQMKLYRVDVTMNLIFQDPAAVAAYLRILKKGHLLPHYQLEFFNKDSMKAKDAKEANRNSYKQSCRSGAFFAYNKTAQLGMIKHFPHTLIGKSVLRIEAQLRRKGMKKWLGGDIKELDNWHIIQKLGNKAPKILKWYLKRILLVHGEHLRYQDALERVTAVKREKTQKRMLHLLKKTSDCRDLTTAVKALREKYSLSSGQCRRILKKFEKLGISPITLPNADSLSDLPDLSSFLN